jgi:hypothetical protein
LVAAGEPGAKPNGRAIGTWRDRRGRPQAGFFDVQAATQELAVVQARWRAESGEGRGPRQAVAIEVHTLGELAARSDAERAQELVEAELDESFFRTRIQRSTIEERRYMRAMAELGPDAQKAADVAQVLGKSSEQVAPLRARLINNGLLCTPRYAYAKFTVPQFDRFMRRYMDLDEAEPAEH